MAKCCKNNIYINIILQYLIGETMIVQAELSPASASA